MYVYIVINMDMYSYVVPRMAQNNQLYNTFTEYRKHVFKAAVTVEGTQ